MLRATITTSVRIEPGSLMSVVNTNVSSVTPVVTSAAAGARQVRARVGPDPQVADRDQGEDAQRHGAPIDAIARQVEQHDQQDDRRPPR